jgi:hypothetical protein
LTPAISISNFINKKVLSIQQSSSERILLQPTLSALSEGIFIQK